MSGCCDVEPFDGVSAGYRRALIAVIAINAGMFIVEITAGFASGSQALKADALDFAGDSATYALSLFVIGTALSVRAKAALFKGFSLAVIAVAILVSTVIKFMSDDVPEAQTISLVGGLALLANIASVLILLRWRDGDSNVRSVWLCSRNDAIGNVAVIIAGLLVAAWHSKWPDLIVALMLCGLFLNASWQIIRQALEELRQVNAPVEPVPAATP